MAGRENGTAPAIVLEHEDCLEFLSRMDAGCADLVLIDPPYEVSRSTNFASGEATGRDVDRFRVSMDFGGWDAEGSVDLPAVLEECFRILRRGGTIICFYDLWKISFLKEHMEQAGFKQIRFIEWLKTNPVPLNSHVNYLTNAREAAVCAVKGGKPTFNSEYDRGIYEYPICHDRGRFHPTQKPLALVEELIEKHSDEGDLVVDCFSGSGTCALAAARTGRRFSGCEASGEYHAKSVERLHAEGYGGSAFPES